MKSICHAVIAGIFTLLFMPSVQAVDIIAHRGASGYLPEHTLAAAALAHAQQPDYIEQDVVLSRDHIPVVLHDIHIETVTNVESVFPDRARKDGRYYAIDFTLAELKTLRVHERQTAKGEAVFPQRFGGSEVDFRIATLREHITLIQQLNRISSTDIGLYTEIKSPAWHRQQGGDISHIVLNTLAEFGLTGDNARFYLQCFDLNEVKRLRHELGYKGKLVMLIGDNSWNESATDFAALRTVTGITALAEHVDGIGPWITHLVSATNNAKPEWLIAAQQQGLDVHPYTFRTDALPYNMHSDALLDILITTMGVNGIFTDQVPAVRSYLNNTD